MSDKETSPETEQLLKALNGDPNVAQKRLIFNDWSFFITIALFLEHCNEKPNPRAYGRHLVSVWRKRLDDGTRKEFAALNKLREDPIVALLVGMMNPQSQIEGSTQDNLNEVTAELLAIVEKLPESQ